MGASPIMSLGLRAMAASYAALQATGHNIANANVDGYSRQEAELATAKGQFSGAGFFGKGVDVKTVARAHDAFLTRAAAIAKSLSEMDAARQQRLSQLEQVFTPGEGGLGHAAGQFLNAMVDLASRPGDNATRQVVLARAQDLATRFNGAGGQLDTLQAGVSEDLRTSVETINGLAKSIAAVNQQIAAVRGLGQPPNDLLDERDRLVHTLSGYVQVSTVAADDGSIGVFVAGGQRLVLATQAATLGVVLDPEDPGRSALALLENGASRVIDPDALGGGSVAGLLRFQNRDLVDGRNLVGQLAAATAGIVNAQQQLGLTLQQPAGSVPAPPLFAIGGPLALPAQGNERNAAGQYAASVDATTVDATALQPFDYELRADPAGSAQWQLTRLSVPPQVRLIASGDVVDGLQIVVSSPPPAATDRFLIKPVAAAATTLKALLTDPRDLAAASPLIALADPANSGTAKVQSLSMVAPPPQPQATARIAFTSGSGDYDWQLLDSSGAVLAAGSGTWQAGETIPAPPVDINGFALALAGVPRAGDVVTVQPTPPATLAANNGNALALAALRDVGFVGRVGGGGGATVTDAYASAMAAVGVRVQTAKAGAEISAAVTKQAELATASASGVNLDEEAARLIQYQQSYQAAAKVLQIAQSVFETLLDTTR